MIWSKRGHEYDEIGDELKKITGIIIYGKGEYGSYLKRILAALEIEYCYKDSTDNAADLMSLVGKGYIVVLAMSEQNRIIVAKKMLSEGLKMGKNLFEYPIFMSFYLYIIAAYRYNKCIIYNCGPVIINQCTLRCKKCISAVPYTQDTNLLLDDAKKQIDILFSKIDYIRVCGIGIGEGFLYNDLSELICYIMNNYSKQIGDFYVVTNGTIMPSDEVIALLERYHIIVTVSNYVNVDGWQEKYDRLIKRLSSTNIEVRNSIYDNWIDMGWTEKMMKYDNEEKIRQVFDNCGMPCSGISNGKIVRCIHGWSANRALYKMEDPDNEIDLTDDSVSKKEIMEFMMGYTVNGHPKICSFCNGYLNNSKEIAVAEQL